MKRLAFILLCLSMALPLLARGSAETTSDAEKMVINWHGQNPRGFVIQEGTPIELDIEQAFPGVDLKPVLVDASDQQQIALQIAAGDVPDFMYGLSGIANNAREAADQGIIRSIEKGWLTELMGGYIKYLNNNSSAEKAWQVSQVDGIQYAIPNISAGNSTGHVMGVRDDWLAAVGLSNDLPETLDEFEDMLAKFRNEDPDGNGRKDQYGYARWSQSAADRVRMGRAGFPNIFGAFGIRVGTWRKAGSGVEFTNILPEYRDALKFLADWWSKDLIDPDSFIMDRTTWEAKYANNQLGISERNWTWQRIRAQSPINAMRKADPDVKLVYLDPPKGPAGSMASSYGGATTAGFFGANASDEMVRKIMAILEWVETDPDRHWRSRLGPVEPFTMPDGSVFPAYGKRVSPSEIVRDTEYTNNEALTKAGCYKYAMHNYRPIEMWSTNLAGEVADVVNFANTVSLHPDEPFIDWPADLAGLGADLQDIEVTFYVKAITGEIDIDAEWDSYVKFWKSAGGDKQAAFVKDYLK